MIDIRLRSKIPPEELEQKIGKILTEKDFNVLLTGPTRVRKPDGSLLCAYCPGVLSGAKLDASYETLHDLRRFQTDNRGPASGTPRVRLGRGTRTRSKNVSSAIIGSFDPQGRYRYCRLTAWTGQEWDKYATLFPLFQDIAGHFQRLVPDRYAVQAVRVAETNPAWVIKGTPFTTITVNNTYPTGVHTDKGDLDEGFSCLGVIRRGEYTGGCLTFPEYRVSVDLQDGDLLLMDAHQWHGNTAMDLHSPDAERISIVCYYRTKMTTCGTPSEEADRARAQSEKEMTARVGAASA